MDYCEWLKDQWQFYTEKPVKVGGPAYSSPCDTFNPGVYIKEGVVFTSRGCNNNCSWCCVAQREGKLRELPITEGNIINDNNFMQTSQKHKEKVFEMLKSQSQICFNGGLQSDLVDDHFVENARNLRIKRLFLACDSDAAIPAFKTAAEKLLNAGFTREHIRCYALIGRDISDEGMKADEARLRTIYEAGTLPFAQLYQPLGAKNRVYHGKVWRSFQSLWSRPAATKAHVERGTDMRNYNT